MENFTLTESLNTQFNNMNYRISKIKIVLKIAVLFLVSLTCQNSIAQATKDFTDIKEVNSFLSQLKTSSTSDYEKLDHLINGSNPAIYVNNNTLKTFGENYTILFSDINSLNYIKNNSLPSNNVEIVRINLKKSTDLNVKIDLSIFSNFSNLKYIYIVSNINITNQNISNMILNNDKKYSILYKINQAE